MLIAPDELGPHVYTVAIILTQSCLVYWLASYNNVLNKIQYEQDCIANCGVVVVVGIHNVPSGRIGHRECGSEGIVVGLNISPNAIYLFV